VLNLATSIFSPYSVLNLFSLNTFSQLLTSLLINLPLGGLAPNFNAPYKPVSLEQKASSTVFESNNVASSEPELYSQLESSSNYRNNTFINPIISYDYKCGHYLGT
jgi:hypothetical protein